MFFLNLYYNLKGLLQFNMYFLILLGGLTLVCLCVSRYTTALYDLGNSKIISFIKNILISGFLLSFLIHCLIIVIYYLYIVSLKNNVLNSSVFLIPEITFYTNSGFLDTQYNNLFSFFLSIDLFGLVLVFLAYFIGFFSIIAVDTRLLWNKLKYLNIFIIFIIVVYFYVSVNNLLIFFFMYECLLLPSFFFVYFMAPGRRAIQASLYFVIWTQIGSFLVLCSLMYLISSSGCLDFSLLRFCNFSEWSLFFSICLFFLGFGIKVPIWPFHYWLTKTHVEAPSGFSIFLSGFLVKSALFGFYKLTTALPVSINNTVFLTIVLLGVIDASLKLWAQTDLKKLVAYCTIQEMNLIYLIFLWGDVSVIYIGILLSIAHGVLSSLMFFMVDCVYRRFHTRSILEVNGLLQIIPNISIAIFLMCVLYTGLPGTIKFIGELYILTGFYEISLSLCLFILFICNVIGAIGFCKGWFNLLFGVYQKNNHVFLDASNREILAISLMIFFLIAPIFFLNLFI